MASEHDPFMEDLTGFMGNRYFSHIKQGDFPVPCLCLCDFFNILYVSRVSSCCWNTRMHRLGVFYCQCNGNAALRLYPEKDNVGWTVDWHASGCLLIVFICWVLICFEVSWKVITKTFEDHQILSFVPSIPGSDHVHDSSRRRSLWESFQSLVCWCSFRPIWSLGFNSSLVEDQPSERFRWFPSR